MVSIVIECRYAIGKPVMHVVLTLPTPDFTVNQPLGPPSSEKKPWIVTGSGSGTSRWTQCFHADAITVLPMRVKPYSFQHVISEASRTSGELSADAARRQPAQRGDGRKARGGTGEAAAKSGGG
jgi:hypothetical protein